MAFTTFIPNICNNGWYTSAMNYDMMSQNPWNTMNLHMNQLWDHSNAWSSMFQVPQYSFNNFTQYGYPYGNSYLTNPMYTLGQMAWGTPAWNNGFSSMWNNNGWNNGWNGGAAGGSSDGSGSADSSTNRKYNRLLSLLKQLVKYDGLTASEQDALNDAIRNTKGSKEEKYDKLLEAYNHIDKDIVRDFLAEQGHTLGVQSEINGNAKNKDSFYNRLLGTGYEYSGTTTDDKIKDLYDAIEALSDKDGNIDTKADILSQLELKEVDILDLISSWNSEYKNDADAKRLIGFIAKKYNKLTDDDQKGGAKNALKTITNSLITKAQSVKKSLDSDSKEAIEDAIDDVRTALNNSAKTVDSRLSGAFDKLYLLTRQAAMEQLRNDAKAYYGEIDNKVFNDKLFEKDMIDDLKEEGFSESEISSNSVKLNEKRVRKGKHSSDDDEGSDSKTDIDKKPAVEQVSYLKDNDFIVEINEKKDGSTTLYREANKTGDRDYYRLYYINSDGKLVEYTNKKIDDDGKISNIKTGDAVGERLVKPSEIESDAQKAEKESDDAKKKTEEVGDYDANSAGKDVQKNLDTWTREFEQREIADLIDPKKLNKDNIYEFLDGFYTANKGDNEGIIEALDDDCDDTSIVTLEMKKNIIESLLEKAKDMNLTNHSAYKDLNKIYEKWKETGKDNFKEMYSSCHWSIDWLGAYDKYSEAIDKKMRKLFDAMK